MVHELRQRSATAAIPTRRALRTLAIVSFAILAVSARAQESARKPPPGAAPAALPSKSAQPVTSVSAPPGKPPARPGDQYVPPGPPVNELGRPPHPDIPGPLKFTDSQVEPLSWSDLDQWAQDNHVEAFTVFRTS